MQLSSGVSRTTPIAESDTMTTDLRASPDILAERDPGKLAWRAIEPVWRATSISDEPEAIDRQLARLTDGQRGLFAIHWCISEVSNGGFDQFFSNPAGNLAQEVREGFVRIGNEVFASIMDQVMAPFPEERPARRRAERLLQLRRMRGPDTARVPGFSPYDDVFLGMLDEVEADMAGYVLEHPEEFVRSSSRGPANER